MKIKELRDLTKNELELKLRDLGQELYNLRAQGKTGQLENSGRIRTVKKEIARIKTLFKEMESNESTGATQ